MQELGFPCLREEKFITNSFLTPSSKHNLLFRTFSMNSHFDMPSKFSAFDPFMASAPATPCRLLFSRNFKPNPNTFSFHSVPNSPGRQIFESSCRCDSSSVTPETAFGDKSSNVDDFEFATSRRFNGDELETSDQFNGDGFETSAGGFDEDEVVTGNLFNVDESETTDRFNSDGFKTSDDGFDTDEVKMSDLFNLDESETSDRVNDDGMETSVDGLNDEEVEAGDVFNVDEMLKFDEIKAQNKRRGRRYHESLPAMAFADDLFSDGKVMPLNPPPSQMYSSCNNTPSPVNPNAKFKIPFTKSLWNDDFDPFMVALETVKEEKREGNHRRARSMLPLPACTSFDPEEMHEHCLHSSPLIVSPNRLKEPIGPILDHNGPVKSPLRLTEPKGVMFARRARMVKLGYNYEKPITIKEPIVLEENGLGRRRRGNTWQKMLSFYLRRVKDEKTETDLNVEFARSKLRKLSFKSKKVAHNHSLEEKKEHQVTKMTLIRYRPKLLLCLGYRGKLAY